MHSPFPHFDTVIKLFPPLISLTPFLGLITVAIPVAESSLLSIGSQHISQSESCPLSECACSKSGFGDHLDAYFWFRNNNSSTVEPPPVDIILIKFEPLSWFDGHETSSDIGQLNFFTTKCRHRTWDIFFRWTRTWLAPFYRRFSYGLRHIENYVQRKKSVYF